MREGSRHSRARGSRGPCDVPPIALAALQATGPVDGDLAFLGNMDEDRRRAEARMSGWSHQVAVSVGRVLSHMFEDGRSATPSQAVSRWLSANCRGGWVQVRVPGRGDIVAMNDARCAERFRVAFGDSPKPPSFAYAD